ncbi:MAG: hypothetical protein H6R15_137 [Proteobacteria bacterium]|nr:hypothetical protein [Pseudomonadota bacterium]
MLASSHSGRRLLQIGGLFAIVILLNLRYDLSPVEAARISDIRGTKHNLSAAADGSGYTSPTAGAGNVPSRDIKATSETQVCVFCHTPHGASSSATPLWNRKVAGNGYTPSYILYNSSTLDANQVQGSLDQPGGSSKLCLSCHDGTVAVGNVNVLNGVSPTPNAQGTSTIATTATTGGGTFMPTGAGASTGFTRNLGVDLTNDHPISVSFNDALANRDGELRTPSANPTLIGVRSASNKPKLKLENTGTPGANQAQVQCATCHDPHLRETNAATVGNQKFLRLNRFQHQDPPSSSGFNTTDNSGDIICLACHDKGGSAWGFSAHANSLVADELYSNGHADRREFPRNLPVWQAACLNCHDTHSVAGSRRLLREGTNEGTSTAAAAKPGGANTAALEETCYQCHDGGGNGTLQTTTAVPNIKSDFALARHMPITNTAQANSPESHDINASFSSDAAFIDCSTAGTRCGKDLIEPRSKLGVANLTNRHVECTDCHNPHRVIRAQNGLPGALTSANTRDTVAGRTTGGGAHQHTNAAGYTHSNAISGVLRGSWGIEPNYGAASFHSLPTGYTVKRGDPGVNTSTLASQPYVTREYQICLKCHSDYGYSDNNSYPNGNRPPLTVSGGTPSGTNGLTIYTNQAKEFQAPASHAAEPLQLGTDAGTADTNFNANNHRSWHPVIAATGRSTASRGMTGNPWLTPWSNAVGTQTMYCTDCHGSAVSTAKSVIPDGSNAWGPHGSSNNFILKGVWSNGMGATGRDSGETANLLCFKCHDSSNYTTRSDTGRKSGFYGGGKGNLHNYHVDRIQKLNCTWCHVAVPHGWKNKALLVNLNDVGEEAGQGVGSSKEVAINGNGSYYKKEPYYLYAKLKVSTFAASGNWADTNCGSRSKSGANLIVSTDGASAGNTTGTGKNWMTSTCSGPTN